jgi:hypothetical protein
MLDDDAAYCKAQALAERLTPARPELAHIWAMVFFYEGTSVRSGL